MTREATAVTTAGERASDPAREEDAPGVAIRLRGRVQGVGMRPVVWRLARECGLAGDVRNDAEGVLIRAWGEPARRRDLLERLRCEAPPLARIDSVEIAALPGPAPPPGFAIDASRGGVARTAIAPDAAPCAACRAEMADPAARRHRYAFTSCTHCGPRLSIARAIPYDRHATSMAAFPLCADCSREYHDPADRRFHAQPIACPACGPRLWLERLGDGPIAGDPVEAARGLLRDGYIVAIKGVGGFQLACDATSPAAVARLRARKRRDRKPFALLAADEAVIRRHCVVDAAESALLRDPAAPIVLLRRRERPEGASLAGAVAPGLAWLGFMLPASPLHALIAAGWRTPLVLTSGNVAGEPQCTADDAARERLSAVADALLLHDREIVHRLDDSVARVLAGTPTLLRRARGHTPDPIALPPGLDRATGIVAAGAELKNAFCLAGHGRAVLGPHIGDLDEPETATAFRDTLACWRALFGHPVRLVAIDAHPGYRSAALGREVAAVAGCPVIEVQHHHGHIAACMADNGVGAGEPPVLGIALDGTGHGADGRIWGGELLLCDYTGFERLAALADVPMPGGEQAIRQPWRMAYAHLRRLGAAAIEEARARGLAGLDRAPLDTLEGMIATGLNCPATSSCGRLFDAVAAVLGLADEVRFEGEAAMRLEGAASDAMEPVGSREPASRSRYPFKAVAREGLLRLDPAPMWRALLDDLAAGTPVSSVALRFHDGLAGALAELVEALATRHGDRWHGRIALSGGVFQNRVLTEGLVATLECRGLRVLRQACVPPGDGGLALGQAVIAAARLQAGGAA